MERDATEVQNGNCFSKEHIASVSYSDLEKATSNFNESNKIGQGGYGVVYRGNLWGKQVAIKKLLNSSDEHQVNSFKHEFNILSTLKHPHLVRLVGHCAEEFCLVYEFMSGGNLEERLQRIDLPWRERLRIGTEICYALTFLHTRKSEVVVHGDVKPENVLLDDYGISKLGDFGISRLITVPTTTTTIHHTTVVKGSYGYLDPAFTQSSRLAPSTDVYAFGMVLLRLLTNKPAGHDLISIVDEAITKKRLEDVLDVAAHWPYRLSVAEELSLLAIKCCSYRVKSRPNMGEVSEILEKIKWEHCEIPSPEQMKFGNVILFTCLELQQATSDFNASNKLGENLSNSVHIYCGELMGAQLTIKILSRPEDAYKVKAFYQEVYMLCRSNHPHIVRLIGVCPENYAVVFEFTPGDQTLEDRLRNNDLSWQDRIRIAIEICSALVFLHSHKTEFVVHGAIHPANIFLDARDNKSRLGSFGLGGLISPYTREGYGGYFTSTMTGEIKGYIDPAFERHGRLTSGFDVYAFGMLLLCLLTNSIDDSGLHTLVQEACINQQLNYVLDSNVNWPSELAEDLANIALKCCDVEDEKRRPRISQVLEKLEQLKKRFSVN